MAVAASHSSVSIPPALHGLLGALVHAYPNPVSRERLCQTLGVSRDTLRQKIRRLDVRLGAGSLVSLGDDIRLSNGGAEASRSQFVPIEIDEPKVSPEDSLLAVSFRTTILEMAEINRDDARAMLVSNAWMTRVLRSSDFGRLLEATRPDSPDRPFAGERRQVETLVLMGTGAGKEAVLRGLARVKSGARRRGQRPLYRQAINLERFVFAGDYDLPVTENLSRAAVLALPFYERLAYLAKLYLDAKEDEVVRATEWVAAGLDSESEAAKLHFWGNTAVLAVFASGRDLAAQARTVAEESPAYRLDRNTQRCVQISMAREMLWRGEIDAAMACASRYKEISDGMGWSNWDYHEIGAKASLVRGERTSFEMHRNCLHDQLAKRGYLDKRFIGRMFAKFDATNPWNSRCGSVTPVVTAPSLR